MENKQETAKEIERAKDNILRGQDIESAAFLLEKIILEDWTIIGGRINVLKTATIQILDFLKESKNKTILDYLSEIVDLKIELNDREDIIDKMALKIATLNGTDQYCIKSKKKKTCPYKRPTLKKCKECVKKYYKV